VSSGKLCNSVLILQVMYALAESRTLSFVRYVFLLAKTSLSVCCSPNSKEYTKERRTSLPKQHFRQTIVLIGDLLTLLDSTSHYHFMRLGLCMSLIGEGLREKNESQSTTFHRREHQPRKARAFKPFTPQIKRQGTAAIHTQGIW